MQLRPKQERQIPWGLAGALFCFHLATHLMTSRTATFRWSKWRRDGPHRCGCGERECFSHTFIKPEVVNRTF